MRTRTKVLRQTEDASSIAGWVYSDLLVALMVIFLATITFVPQVFNSAVRGTQVAKNEDKPIYNYLQFYEKPLVKVYDDFNIDFIKQDIENFLATERLPINSFIGAVQIVGGYDMLTEEPSTAVARAVQFSQKIDEADPRLLSRSSTTISSTTNIFPNQIVLRITFVVNYGVTN